MTSRPFGLYESALEGGGSLTARHADGMVQLLSVHRWLADADHVDERLIDRARGPVLDLGCGPGAARLGARAARDPALGLDASPIAVRLASARGADAVLGDVFEHGLEIGAWETVLLLDGNLGIGGDPVALLRRTAELLTPTGQVLVEADRPGSGIQSLPIRLERGDDVSSWSPWARVGLDRLDVVAADAGLRVADRWCDEGRWFAELQWA